MICAVVDGLHNCQLYTKTSGDKLNWHIPSSNMIKPNSSSYAHRASFGDHSFSLCSNAVQKRPMCGPNVFVRARCLKYLIYRLGIALARDLIMGLKRCNMLQVESDGLARAMVVMACEPLSLLEGPF
jgi:hypothetical protein